jgi:hypothetical protein
VGSLLDPIASIALGVLPSLVSAEDGYFVTGQSILIVIVTSASARFANPWRLATPKVADAGRTSGQSERRNRTIPIARRRHRRWAPTSQKMLGSHC